MKNSISNKPIALEYLIQAFIYPLSSIARPSEFKSYLHGLAKYPLTQAASRKHKEITSVSFSEFFQSELKKLSNAEYDTMESLSRRGWNTRLDEEIYLALAVRAMQPKAIFEIGTFDGNTTSILTREAPANCAVHTLDLPEDEFNATQFPKDLTGAFVGCRYRESGFDDRIIQLRGNSQTFDFSAYHDSIDFLFIDAAHDYKHGVVDSRNALKMAHPGSVIFWHDFDPSWPGLVNGIVEACEGLPLKRIDRTTLAVLRVPE